ncbi:MAG: ATP-binding protein [Acidobacteriota bacterium]
MSELNTKLIWLMAIRILVVLSLLLPNLISPTGDDGEGGLIRIAAAIQELLSPTLDDEPVSIADGGQQSFAGDILQMLVAFVSTQTLLYAALLRFMGDRPKLHAYLQFAGDLLLISLLIYKFGGATVNLSVLYFVVIAVASFLLRRRGGLVVATAATLLYGLVSLAHQSTSFRGLWAEGGPFSAPAAIEQPSGERTPPNFIEKTLLWAEPPDRAEVTGVPVAYTLPVHIFGFYAVALFAAYLARDLALERKLEQRSMDLAYLQVLHRDVIQSISSGMLVTDLDGVTTNINRAGAQILALAESEFEGRHVCDIGLFTRDQWRELTKDKEHSEVTRGETELTRHSGERFLGYTLSPLRDADGEHRGFILIFQDLTEWRGLQDQLRIQDRMAALGQMAAGLAHEVGNPLAAISGSVQMLSSAAETGSSSAKLLNITLRESRRLDRTVKNFLQFARPRDRHEEPIDICELLQADLELLRNSDEVISGHELVADLEPPSAIVVLDRDQVSQIFWNLARNALQAMPDGGTLRVVGRIEDERYLLRFSDQGRGMSKEERDQLFQPFKSFFDGGMGLGMAIVYRIVEEHRGNIEVDSEPGRGTTITIDLPLGGGARFEEMPT